MLTYSGRVRGNNLIITNLSITSEYKNAGGCSFTATLQKANITTSAYIEIGETLMSQDDAREKTGNKTAATKNAGMTTTVSEAITGNAYTSYVNSYNGKSSGGPSSRKTAGYDGVR
ncbi:MAG: phage baseplate protein [Eisenbergiella massiliensis]